MQISAGFFYNKKPAIEIAGYNQTLPILMKKASVKIKPRQTNTIRENEESN